MIDVPAILVSWLNATPTVTAQVADRISVILNPADGFPAVVIGLDNVHPTSTASRSVSPVETGIVTLYCYAGRRGVELDSLPDLTTARALAAVVEAAMSELDAAPFVTGNVTLKRAAVKTATPGIDTGGFARYTINADMTFWVTAQ